MNKIRRVAVIGGARIPFARSNTAYATATNAQMLTAALRGVVSKYSLEGEAVGEVSAGAVMKHSWEFNMTREAVLDSGLAPETPACDVQMACGTSLQATLNLASKIATYQIDSAIAAGTDTTSDAAIPVSDRMRNILMEANRARTTGDRIKAIAKLRPKDLIPKIPANAEPRTGLSMGEHCEMMAKEWDISREEQDAFALKSHQNLAAAYERGFMADLITPFNGLTVDNNLRPDINIEKLAKLKPAFDKTSGKGTLTAANSSTLTDGASAVLLASEEWAKEHGAEVQAYITFGKTAAVEFTQREGLLMAPAYAMSKMLEDAEAKLQDFDFYEIHEAFAAQVLCTLRAWEDDKFCKERLGLKKALGPIDPDKINLVGSSLATGHPFGATGGRVVATLAKQLHEKGSGRGLISVCAAGGMGVTAILEAA